MRVLALDSALDRCSAAIAKNHEVIAYLNHSLTRGHAEKIIPMMEEVSEKAKVSYGELDAIAVTVGPGSFTGVRTGLSVGRALGLARKLPVIGISTLQGLAWSVPHKTRVLSVIDARRGEVFLQTFSLKRTPENLPCLINIEKARKTYTQTNVLLVGNGASLIDPDKTFRQYIPKKALAEIIAPRIKHEDILVAARTGPPRPLYLR